MRELVRGRSPIKNSQSVPGVQTVKLLHITIICQRKILQKQWIYLAMISSVQSLSRIQLFATLWTAARQASLSITNCRSLPKSMSIESVMPSNHLILCYPLLFLPSIFPRSGSFQMSQLFTSAGQSIAALASTSVLSMNTQGLSPLGWTGWIALQSKRFSRVSSNTTAQKHQFVSAQLSLESNCHIHTWPLQKP